MKERKGRRKKNGRKERTKERNKLRRVSSPQAVTQTQIGPITEKRIGEQDREGEKEMEQRREDCEAVGEKED